jgi:hypothetical protein
MRNFIIFLFALAAFALFGFLLYLGFVFLQSQYRQLDEGWIPFFWLFSLLMVVCTLILAGAIRFVATRGDKPVLPEKAAVYQKLLEHLDENGRPDQLPADFRKSFALWANSDVLARFINWYDMHQTNPTNDVSRRSAQRLIMEIRRDLGHKSTNLKQEDILRIMGK